MPSVKFFGILLKFKDSLIDALQDKITLLSLPVSSRDDKGYKDAWKAVEERIEDINVSVKLLEERKQSLLDE